MEFGNWDKVLGVWDKALFMVVWGFSGFLPLRLYVLQRYTTFSSSCSIPFLCLCVARRSRLVFYCFLFSFLWRVGSFGHFVFLFIFFGVWLWFWFSLFGFSVFLLLLCRLFVLLLIDWLFVVFCLQNSGCEVKEGDFEWWIVRF